MAVKRALNVYEMTRAWRSFVCDWTHYGSLFVRLKSWRSHLSASDWGSFVNTGMYAYKHQGFFSTDVLYH